MVGGHDDRDGGGGGGDDVMVLVLVIIVKLQTPLKTFLGRVYIYMGKREFVSIDGVIEPIKGVVHIQVNNHKSPKISHFHCLGRWLNNRAMFFLKK